LEFFIDQVGLFQNPLFVRRSSSGIVVQPMKLSIMLEQLDLKVYLEQELSRLIRDRYIRQEGFTYFLDFHRHIVIRRLVVNLQDIEMQVDKLIAEANRIYMLYCENI
jgi:hypothetical protein